MVEHRPHTERLRVEPKNMEARLADLFAYWSGFCDGDASPVWSGAGGAGFRLMVVPPKVLPVLTIVDLGSRHEDFIYRYWGSERQVFLGNRPDPTRRASPSPGASRNTAPVWCWRSTSKSGATASRSSWPTPGRSTTGSAPNVRRCACRLPAPSGGFVKTPSPGRKRLANNSRNRPRPTGGGAPGS